MNYWKLGNYLMYCSTNKIKVSATLRDSFRLHEIDLRRYNLALKSYQESVARTYGNEKFTIEYYRTLFEIARQFSPPERDFLYFQTVQNLAKINKQNNERLISSINHEIFTNTADKNIKEKIGSILGLYQKPEIAAINLENINGKLLSFSDVIERQSGKISYVDFWASWCLPCRNEFPESRKLITDFPDVSYIFISIDQDKDQWIDAVKKESLPVDNCYRLRDSDINEVQRIFEFTGIPHYVVFGKNGSLIIKDAPRPSDPESRLLLTMQ